MYTIESRNILTPQNGLNIYRGRTENSIMLTEIPGADSMDIGVKVDATELLTGVLRTRRNKSVILMGNMGDPYNELEKEYGLTRNSLKVIEMNDYGVVLSTKRDLIERDMDILSGITSKTKCVVELSFPTLDEEKVRLIEGEEVISIKDRLRLIKTLRKEDIDVLITTGPIIPFVNDSDIREVVQCLAQYDILGIDLMDYRLAIKKSVRQFFYKEYRERFPKEYKMFSETFSETGELVPPNAKEELEVLQDICKEKGLMFNSQKIKAWKRQYENKTVGQQMSLLDLGVSI